MKLKGALLYVVAASFCALTGLISPQVAAASVEAVNQWPLLPTIVSNTSTAVTPVTYTGSFTSAAGTDRYMLIAVVAEMSVSPTAMTVSYNGNNLTMAQAIASNTGQAIKTWLFALNDAQIGAYGTARPLSVQFTHAGTITAAYTSAAVFAGVNQTTPTTGVNANSKAAAGTTLALSIPLTSHLGLVGNSGLTTYIASWDGATTSTPSSGYTEIRDYQGTNFSMEYSSKSTTGTTAEAPTSTGSAAVIAAAVGVNLNPTAKPAAIAIGACGECHGTPPQDGPYVTGRNVPSGQFPGAHSKHAGTDANQYKQACTVCHYIAADVKHSTGFKNISGSKVPRNTYGGVTNIAITNAPGYTQTCTKSTCHSSGRINIQYAPSPVWTGTTTCLSCHGGRASGTNVYARSASNFTMSTTHQQHLGKYPAADMNCNHCHGKIATSNTALKDYTGAIYHGNGSKNVIFKDIAYGSYTSYKTSGTDINKCTNTSCHGGKSRNAWTNTGAVNADHTCSHCHGVAGTLSTLPNINANRKFFAPGYQKTGTSTDQLTSSNDVRVGSHFKHLSSVYMKAIKCNECHQVPSTPFGGGNHTLNTLRYNSNTLTFAQASTANIVIGVLPPTIPTRNPAFSGYTSGIVGKAATCSSTYCHGSRLKTADTSGSYTKPYWNYSAMVNYTNPGLSCGRCHGNPPRSGSSAVTHQNYTSVTKRTVTCYTCHSMMVNTVGTITDKTLHINGQVNATAGHQWSYGGLKHKNGGTGYILANPNSYSNCTGCHSLTGGGSYPVTRGVAANINCAICHINQTNFTSTPGCGDCHGTNANGGQPTAITFPNWSGSHGGHVTQMAYACNDCHINGGTGKSIHGNYSGKAAKTRATVNVGFDTAKSGTAATYNSGTMRCSTSNCHGQISPVWGTRPSTTQCTICHGQANGAYLTNYSSALIAPGGSGRDTGGNTASSSPRVGSHQQHLTASNRLTGHKVHCGECHTVHTTVNAALHLNMTTASIVFGPLAKANSHIPSVTRTGGVMNCSNVYCHHGKRPDGTGAGQRGNTAISSWAFNGVSVLDNTTIAGTCTDKCHSFPPGRTVSGDTHFGIATPTTVAGLAACSSFASGGSATGCHPSIKARAASVPANFTNLTSVFVDQGIWHINAAVEGGSCTGCHASTTGTGRIALTAQFTGVNNSHHYQGAAAIDGKACYACHWEADATGGTTSYHGGSATPNAVVDLVVWGANTTRPAIYAGNVVTYQSGGTATSTRAEFAKINTHCLGCHNATNAATQTFTLAGDTSTPTKYAWDGLSIEARYGNTGTTPWGKFTGNDTNAKSAQTKAFSAHGRATANPRGWTTVADTYTAATATSNVLCFDCHNSHGTSNNGTAITSSYSSATGRRKGGILKDTVAGRGGYTVAYKPAANATNGVKSVYSSGAGLCFDCHNTQTAAGSIPWGYQGTYGYTPPAGAASGVLGYNDTPHFGASKFPSTITYPYKAGKSTNAGGHFGASSAMVSAITKRAMDAGNTLPSDTNAIKGLCTPCHDPHGVSTSLGTNQQYSVPLLKGTFVTSPYKQDVAPVATNEIRGGGSGQPQFAFGSTVVYYLDQRTFQTAITGKPVAARSWNFNTSANTLQPLVDTQFAGLCIGCHLKTSINNAAAATTANWKTMSRVHNSVKGWASTGGGNAGNVRHAFTCSKCHASHNSRLPRLSVTNCLDVKHRGRVATGGSMAAAQTGTGSRGSGIGRFPTGGYGAGAPTATNPGAWFFGTKGGNPTAIAQPCHNTATAGGTTYNPVQQQWNTKTLW